jgi:hypothetical protein
LLFEPAQNFALPTIAERPTPQQVAATRSLLLDDLLGDFPFVGDAERAHSVALLLLPFMRPMIPGPTPLHMVRKTGARHQRHADGRRHLHHCDRHKRERHSRGPRRGRVA